MKMDIFGLQMHKEYYWKSSEGWTWFGTPRWWEIFVEISGLNGAGGVWLAERWRWNGSSETIREQIKTLSYEDTVKLIDEIKATGN